MLTPEQQLARLWLQEKNHTLWGRAFDIGPSSPSLEQAAVWWIEQWTQFRDFVASFDQKSFGNPNGEVD